MISSQSPLVSVIIPAYNAETTILGTIQSVLAQTIRNLEVLVVNDGSRDRTSEVVASISDPRVKLFNQENAGVSAARNLGMEHSIGQYLSFIDSDDQWTPDKLELQLQALQQNPKAGVVYSWTSWLDEKGQSLYPAISASYTGNVHRPLLEKNFIGSGSNVLITREVVDRVGYFDPNLKVCEDWDYWLRIAPHFEFVVVPKYQVLYRLRVGSLSGKLEEMDQSQWIVLEKAFQAAPPELQYLRKQGVSQIYRYTAQLALSRGETGIQVKLARQKLWQAVRSYPKTVLQRRTQSLLVKWLIFQVLPMRVAESVLQSMSHAVNAKTP